MSLSLPTAAPTPGIDLPTFRRWLTGAHPALPAPDTATLLTGGRSNLTMLLTGPDGEMVLRRPPLGALLESANDMGREYRVQSALQRSSVPVADMLAHQPEADPKTGVDATFYLMSRIDGVALEATDDNAGHEPAAIDSGMRHLARTLAELHALTPSTVGLAELGRPDGYLARQLGRWARQLDAASDRTLPRLRELATRLAPAPETTDPAICHGDFKPQNALFRFDGSHGEVAGIIDWEMATLGDAAADLALFGMYWTMPRLHPVIGENFETPVDASSGYPLFTELLDEYASVRPVPELTWHLAFSAFKTGVISELIHQRHLAGTTVGEGYDRMGEQVEVLAQIGLDVLAGRDILMEG